MALLPLWVIRVLVVAQATIAGTVRDAESGRPVRDAVVLLTDLRRAATTDDSGRYVLDGVPAGPQHLTVRAIGFVPHSLHALVPSDGRLEIHVALAAAPFPLPALEVRLPIPVRGLDPSDSAGFPDRGLSIAAVRVHPQLAEPDGLLALAGGEVTVAPEVPSGLHLRGGAADHTAYLLDGIPVFSPYHAAGLFSAWNPDALAGLHLWSTVPSPALPDALSGTVSATTQAPGASLRVQAGLSSTQARLTADGPLGVAGAGFLVSVRTGFPGGVPPKREGSYLKGKTGDWLAKVEAPLFRGRIRLLGYGSESDLNAAAVSADESSGPPGRRHEFEWASRSLGIDWERHLAPATLRVLGWSATAGAASVWAPGEGAMDLSSTRSDVGFLASAEHATVGGTTLGGVRVQGSRTSYGIQSPLPDGATWHPSTDAMVATLFGQHARPLGRGFDLQLGASLSATGDALYLSPRGQLRWRTDRWTLSAAVARQHQFTQSLRNSASVVGSIFPADLPLAADRSLLPVARSDQAVIAAEWRPLAGMRLAVQGYQRHLDGVVMVAPVAGLPFATGPVPIGSGRARGASVEASHGTARYGLLASYGVQQVRFEGGGLSYTPDYVATHQLEGGAIVFPTATVSVRLGVTAALGRRTTPILSGFEWESCSLGDQGCEFSGSPLSSQGTPGGATLPDYLRVDLGLRKHWHLEVAGRDAQVAIFGTVTNLFGRRNALTWARDPASGRLVALEMRPRAPLVVGLDWRF